MRKSSKSKAHESGDWRDMRFICIGPNAWGRGSSVTEAQRNCHANNSDCIVYEAQCSDVGISGIDGSLFWPAEEARPVVVWFGKRFETRNKDMVTVASAKIASNCSRARKAQRRANILTKKRR